MHIPPPPSQFEKKRFPLWAWALLALVPISFLVSVIFAFNQVSGRFSGMLDDLESDGSSEGAGGADLTDFSVYYALGLVDEFVDDVGRWPTKEEGFAALIKKPKGLEKWKGPYADESDLVDQWDQKMRFEVLPKGYRITSFGKDGKPGGKGENADLMMERFVD